MRSRPRRAAVTLEFLLGFVVLFGASLAAFQFFMLGLTQQVVVSATIEAARFGAQVAVDDSIAGAGNVAAIAAEAYLRTQGLELFDDSDATDGVMRVERRRGDGPIEWIELGDGPACPPAAEPTSPLAANQIRVTICFPLVDATSPTGLGNPVGNWLASLGFDLSDMSLRYTATALLE